MYTEISFVVNVGVVVIVYPACVNPASEDPGRVMGDTCVNPASVDPGRVRGTPV